MIIELKKKCCILLVLTMIFGYCFVSYAAEGYAELPMIHDVLAETSVNGRSKPSKDAETVNLGQNSYGYEVTDIGYRVYTNKWLTGATSIKVSVADWKLKEDYGGKNDELTVAVYDETDNVVAKNTITITWSHDESGGYGSLTLGGLNSNSRYYVLFEVPTNRNKYSFDGNIYKDK